MKIQETTRRSERNEANSSHPSPDRTGDHRTPATTLLTRHEGGYAAQGPGFFVWDRDPGEVIRIAEALQSGRLTGSRSARFLVIEPDATSRV